MAEGFRNKWNACNSLDSKHAAIRCPSNTDSFCNKFKGIFSVVLMAFVGAQYKFMWLLLSQSTMECFSSSINMVTMFSIFCILKWRSRSVSDRQSWALVPFMGGWAGFSSGWSALCNVTQVNAEPLQRPLFFLPRQAFLTMIKQYWFLFDCVLVYVQKESYVAVYITILVEAARSWAHSWVVFIVPRATEGSSLNATT